MADEPPLILMEDHCDAYPAWRELGVHRKACVHLDAHLDLSDEGIPKDVLDGMRAAGSGQELRRFQSNPRLPWGGYHAGNYLYPALLDDTVSHLYWVIPPWLPRGQPLLEWTRCELQNWYQVSLQDYASLKLVEGRVEGSVLGRAFTLCTLEHLPMLEGPALLDVDVDYFLDQDDSILAAPHQVLEQVKERLPNPTAITVSYSVNGGYTPLEHRYLGDILVSRPAPSTAEACLQILAADALRARGEFREASRAYERVLAHGGVLQAPLHFKLSLALALAGLKEDAKRHAVEAARLDEHYRPKAIDMGFLWFRRRHYARTLEWLRRAREDDPLDTPLTLYIEGLAHLREMRLTEAVGCFERLRSEPALRPSERAWVGLMLGRTLLEQGRAGDAVLLLREAVDAEPSSGLYHMHLAHGLRAYSVLDEAARHYRKSIALAGDTLASLEAHRNLAEVYEETGHRLLAAAETRRLIQKDVVGTFAMRAMMGRHRSS